MKLLKLNSSGKLNRNDIELLGGEISRIDKIKHGGVGSPKIVYLKGISFLDEIDRQMEGELNFVNFKLMNNGLVLFSNTNQRTLAFGFLKSEIRSIRILLNNTSDEDGSSVSIQILTVDSSQIDFRSFLKGVDSIINYFQKPVFEDLLSIAQNIR